MEVRKIQKTGGSSFILSLPKDWIKDCKIKKGDSLGIIQQSDGTLLITPQIADNFNSFEKIIEIDDIENPVHLSRRLIGAYIMGSSKIIVKSGKPIQPEFHQAITNFIQISIGFEVIEETNYVIQLKDLINPAEMPFDKTLKRMYIIAEEMFMNSIKALIENDLDLAENVISRDNQVDRLHWLINRQFNLLLSNIALAHKMGISVDDGLYFFMKNKYLERIADHAVKIANNTQILKGKHLKMTNIEEILEAIRKTSKMALMLLDNAADAWRARDLHEANQTIDQTNELSDASDELTKMARASKDAKVSACLGNISESINRVGEYAADIAELVVDFLMRP